MLCGRCAAIPARLHCHVHSKSWMNASSNRLVPVAAWVRAAWVRVQLCTVGAGRGDQGVGGGGGEGGFAGSWMMDLLRRQLAVGYSRMVALVVAGVEGRPP